ncbi:MAG: AAA family ATPase [Lachnospiraceae bacterium]|nr:AAA family ATPase [Lachnospiraceae bacterium]
MAIKIELGQTQEEKRLHEIIELLQKRSQKNAALERVIANLKKVEDGKREPEIKPLSLYVETWDTIRGSRADSAKYGLLLENAKKIYDDIFVLGENTPDFETRAVLYKDIIHEDGALLTGGYVGGSFDFDLFSSFADKNNYKVLIRSIKKYNDTDKILDAVSTYGLRVREYIIDDYGYLSNLLIMVRKLAGTNPDNYEAIIDEAVSKVERSNGVYDISPERLALVEKNVSTAEAIVASGKELFDGIELKSKTFEAMADELSDKAANIVRISEETLDAKAQNAKAEVELALKEYIAAQKKTIIMEKDILLKQVFSDAETELNKYKSLAKALTANTSAEIAMLGKDADAVVDRLGRTVHNDEKINEFLTKAKVDEAILEKIEKLSVLNNASIDRMVRQADNGPVPPMAPPMPGGEHGSEGPAPMGAPGFMPPPPHGPHMHRHDGPIAPVSPLLDRSIPFSERFKLVMAEKKRRMDQGELFHEMFDDVITAVMEDVNPYLIGPSGCGKTYMIMQVGQILGLTCDDIGYINEEYDILGYVTATGEYSESNFYRLYKYGGIAFCDELDNGNSKATVKLNSFLTNKIDSSYSFPGGERVQRHPNFRVIAAGNTDGSGADVNYSTREKIEESVQQRMIPIYIDYDNRVEQAILKDYPDWFEFVCAFRKATDKWGEVCGIPASGIVTTRDTQRIRTYLENGSFSIEKIIIYEFIQTKDPEYLAFLAEELDKRIDAKSATRNILTTFTKQVELVRSKGRKY